MCTARQFFEQQHLYLCADCLRVRELEGYDLEKVCNHCGGELCPCSDCQETIGFLMAGARDAETLGTKTDIADWTPTHGVHGQ